MLIILPVLGSTHTRYICSKQEGRIKSNAM